MRTTYILPLAALALVSCQTASQGASLPVSGEPPEQAAVIKAGFDLSEALCSGCHADAEGQISPNPASPSFMAIANTPGLTQQTLKTWLLDSHNFPRDMNIEVSEEDADLLAAYIITLKDGDYSPPAQ